MNHPQESDVAGNESDHLVISMIALDLDGTILERGAVIREEVIERLVDLAGRGVICVTATGRPIDFQRDLLERHGIGAASGLFSALMVDEREIFILDADGGYVSHAAWNDKVRADWEEVYPMAMELLDDAGAECNRRGWAGRPHHDAAESYARGLPTLYVETPERSQAIRDWVENEIVRRNYPLASNRNVHIVQIFDARVGKGAVLEEMCRVFDLLPRQVLAIGDSTNDNSMLDGSRGFRPGTVGNADPSVKQLVRENGGYVAEAHAGLGVVEIAGVTRFGPGPAVSKTR